MPVVQRVVQAIRVCVEGATAFIFASFIVIVVVQVFCRYVLNESLVWSEEVVRFALYWMTMLSIAMAADRKGHIVMDMLETSLAPRPRRWLEFINAALSVLFLGILVFYGLRLIDQSWETRTAITDISMSYIYLATPVGCMAAAILTIDAVLRRDAPAREEQSA